MKFYRIYIEITNVCGLSCSFCPSKNLPVKQMDLEFFEYIIKQAHHFTKEIACHVIGDPLTQRNLQAYLDILLRYDMKAVLTTSGYFLKKHSYETLFHPAVKQINISLNSFNKNDTALTFDQYMTPIIALCHAKNRKSKDIFINLRIWNFDEKRSEKSYNQMLFDRFSHAFGSISDIDHIYKKRPRSIRLAPKILIHFDDYFEWPSLDNEKYGDGKCLGLQSHIAVLASGKVVPCCLDCDGIIELGDLHNESLDDILHKKRAVAMIEGFKAGKAVEELCQKCSYKERFSLSS